jgi:hypothetical protein
MSPWLRFTNDQFSKGICDPPGAEKQSLYVETRYMNYECRFKNSLRAFASVEKQSIFVETRNDELGFKN